MLLQRSVASFRLSLRAFSPLSGLHPASRAALIGALCVASLTALPYVLHTLHPDFQGLTVIRDKDFGNYFSRIERALEGYPSEADNAITPVSSDIEGAQVAGVEILIGTLFAWTGLAAPTLSTVLGPIVSGLLFLLFFGFFRVLMFPPWWAFSMAAVYFTVTFHTITRFAHPGWSFLLVLAALALFFLYSKQPSLPLCIVSAFLLGLLPYVYFWGWTFAWMAALSIVILAFISRREEDPLIGRPSFLALGVAMTLLVSLPFAFHALEIARHPAYPEVAVRGSFLQTRGVESLPRSLLLLTQTLLFLSLFRKEGTRWDYLAVLSLLLGVLLAMHQNLIHGTLLMFSSHYYPFLLLATLAAGSWVLLRPSPVLPRAGIAGIAAIFLLAGAWDYAPGHRFLLPRAEDFRDQHLLSPLRILRGNGTADVVLTDATTGRVVTAFTGDGIVYTTHARFLLISDTEMAERYCLSELFAPEPPESHRALYMEYNAVLDSPAMRAHEAELVADACARVREDPAGALRKYGVTHVLWNPVMRPEWRIAQYDLPLKVLDAGEEWLLLTMDSSN